MNYVYASDTIKGILERHVLEDPEYHEKTDPETGMGTGELEDPHCDWCWKDWPCEVSQLAQRIKEIDEEDYTILSVDDVGSEFDIVFGDCCRTDTADGPSG